MDRISRQLGPSLLKVLAAILQRRIKGTGVSQQSVTPRRIGTIERWIIPGGSVGTVRAA
jgi:hypothetical protein